MVLFVYERQSTSALYPTVYSHTVVLVSGSLRPCDILLLTATVRIYASCVVLTLGKRSC